MRRAKIYTVPVVILVLLLAARMVLPYAIRHRINAAQGDANGPRWHVKDVRIHLWRGAYEIEDAVLYRGSGSDTAILFSAARVTSTIRWKPRFRSAPTMVLEAVEPRLNVFHDPNARKPKAPPDWRKALRRLSLLRLSGFSLRHGEVRFRDAAARPAVDLYAKEVDMDADHLFRGGQDSSEWAGLRAKGLLMGSGRFDLGLRLRPETQAPTFTLDFSLHNMDLAALESALRAYADMGKAKGRLDMDTHASGAEGRFHGTIHSALRGFEMADAEGKEADGKKKGLVKAVENKAAHLAARLAGKILEKESEKNEAEGKAPPKADFSGRFPEEVKDAWSMSEYVLQESFRKALKP